MKRCDNCGVKLKKDGIRTHEGVFCCKDCADGIVLPHNCIEHQPVPEYGVKFIAEEPVPIYPNPESVTIRIKKHCTRCASIIGAEGWKGVSGIFCSKECAMGQEIPTVTPPVKEEITLFDHYAAQAMAALIIADNKQSITYIVDTAASYALIALEERKKYIND